MDNKIETYIFRICDHIYMKFGKGKKEHTHRKYLLLISKFTVILGYLILFCGAIHGFLDLDGTQVYIQGQNRYVSHQLQDYIFLYAIGNIGIVSLIFIFTDIFKTFPLKRRLYIQHIPCNLLYIEWMP